MIDAAALALACCAYAGLIAALIPLHIRNLRDT